MTTREHCAICSFPLPAVPGSWHGPIESFLTQFIKPRLPAPERLESWCRWITAGIATSRVVVVRAHGPLKRGTTTVIDGLKVRASDLSPVWAVQQQILHGDPPTEISFAEWALSLPLEHNTVRQRRLDLLNHACFHMAHMFDVGANRLPSPNSALGMREACLLELHPSNVFWLPKPQWQHWGASPQVKPHYAALMKHYVPGAWSTFVGMINADTSQLPPLDRKFDYSYHEDLRRPRTTEPRSHVKEGEPSRGGRRWCGTDEKGRFRCNGVVRLLESPLQIRLRWRRSPGSPTKLVGHYRLDLHALLKHGYIRNDTQAGEVRLQFVHDGNSIYIQSRPSRRLKIGRFA
jgi:hypothetical protein